MGKAAFIQEVTCDITFHEIGRQREGEWKVNTKVKMNLELDGQKKRISTNGRLPRFEKGTFRWAREQDQYVW